MLKHLSELQRKKIIDGWHGGKIKPGEKWDESVKNALHECEVVLFLVSSDFLASDYINNIEIKIAFERYEKGEIKIIPIILRPCVWNENELSKFQALPKRGKPLSTWENIDEGLYNVTKGITRVVQGKRIEETYENGKKQKTTTKKKHKKKPGMRIKNKGKIENIVNANKIKTIKFKTDGSS